MVLTKFLWTTCLALNILDTLKAVSRPPIRPKRKYTTQQPNDRTARILEQTDEHTANDGSVRSIRGEVEGWQPTKRLKTEKRERWRVLLQNWIAWAAFVQIEPFIDNSVGLFMPFYGHIKILFLLYLLVARPSGGSVIYQSLIQPRLAKHARTVDLTSSFLFLVAEWVFQIGLMLAVLPFVRIWSGLRRVINAVWEVEVGRWFTMMWFWKKRGREGARIDEEEDVVENSISRMIQDDRIRIEITTTTSPHPSHSHHQPPPTSPTPSPRRQSLIPSTAAITAYTLSSPQTLRRAVDQAREIYQDIDGKRKEVGKKRGEGELVRGMMKKRVQEMEEKRGKGASAVPVVAKRSEVKVQEAKLPEVNAIAGPSTGTTRGSHKRAPYKKRSQTGASTVDQSVGDTVVPPTAARGRGRGRGAGKQTAETGRRVGGRAVLNAEEAQRNRLTGWTASATVQTGESRTGFGLKEAGPSGPLPGSQPPTLESQPPAQEAALAPPSTALEQQPTASPLEQPSALSRYVYPSITSLLPQSHTSIVQAPEPSASSGSTFGLGFGDIGGTEETSIASTEETRTQRSLFVPGGFPLVSSPASVRTFRQGERTRQSPLPFSAAASVDVVSAESAHIPTSDASTSHLAVASQSQSVPSPDASTSQLNVPGSSEAGRLERPLLRKNNSLGLVGTLDSMRSPSLEPTSAFANPPAIRGKDPLSSYSHATIQSRLRPQSIIDVETAADRIISQQSSLQGTLATRMQSSSQGIYVPLMPLPLVTPATSPSIHQAASIPPTPDIGGPSLVAQAVIKETVVDERQPPQSPKKTIQEEKPRERPAESSDLSELDDTPMPSAFAPLPSVAASASSEKPRTVTRIPFGRPGGPVRPTRAVRPGSKTASDATERNRTTRATSDSKFGSQARREKGALSTSRIAVGQDKTVRAKPVASDSDASRTASTSTAALPSAQTAANTINDRKRKEPPQTMPVPVQRRVTNAVTLRSGTQRAARPVIPAAVIKHREFALPEGIIAAVTPARRARASMESSGAASQVLGSPTKRRKTDGGQVATAPILPSGEQSENENEQEQGISPWRSRRMRARPSSND